MVIRVGILKRVSKLTGRTRYYLRYKDPINGNDKRVVTNAKTRREAEVLAHKKEQEINAADYGLIQQQRTVMFFDIIENYIACKKAHKRSWKRDELSIRHLKEVVGNRKCVDMNKGMFYKYVAKRKEDGVSNATINRELSCLKSVFYMAQHDGLISHNPMARFKLLPENNERNRELSEKEFQSLLFASANHLRPILIFAWETGWRKSEILELKWSDIKLDQNMIYGVDCKTRIKKRVPVNKTILKTISRLERCSDYVFTYKGKRILSVKRSFQSACKRARIENFRFHDFRHCFVTRKRREGHRDKAIMAITGHQQSYMLRRYDRVSDEDVKKVMGTGKENTWHKSGTKGN